MWRYWLYRAAKMRDILWALVNVVVKAVSSVYGEGQLAFTGECRGMDSIEGLWRGTVGGNW
jgi:hypothetical protein